MGETGTIGPYKVLEPLSARSALVESRSGSPFVLKRLSGGEANAAAYRARYETACASGSLALEGVVGVEEYAGEGYLVYRFVPGTRIDAFVRGRNPSRRELAGLVRDVAEALASLHERGVVHGRVMAGNVIVTDDRHVRLIDLPPEATSDTVLDLVCLGHVLRQCLGERDSVLAERGRSASTIREAADDLDEIARRARTRIYRAADAMARDLDAYCAGKPLGAPDWQPPVPLHRRPEILAAVGAVLAAVVAFVSVLGSLLGDVEADAKSATAGTGLRVEADAPADGSAALQAGEKAISPERPEPGDGTAANAGTGAVAVPAPPPDPALVGWWKLDDTRGAIARDASPGGGNGTLMNMGEADWVAGRSGGALDFDGADDHVVVARSQALEPARGLTVSAWARITGACPGAFADIVRKAEANGVGFLLRWSHKDGRLQFHVKRAAASVVVADTQANSAYLNAWHHYAATYDAASGVARLFVDGAERSSATGAPGPLEHSGNLFLMYAAYQDQAAVPGVLDDVRVYSRALLPGEVRDIFDAPCPPVIVSTAPTHAYVNQPYGYTIRATGKPAPKIAVSGLTAWLAFDGKDTILGTPRSGYLGGTVTVTAANGVAPDATQQFTVKVSASDPSLLGWWKFDETRGTMAADSSRNARTAALTGMAGNEWTAGAVGGALAFRDADDRVLLGGDVDIASEWTIAAWFPAPLPATATWHTMTRGQGKDHQIMVDSSLTLGTYDNGNGEWRPSSPVFNMGSLLPGWHHIAAVGAGTTTAFYIDGAAVGASDRKSESDVCVIGNYQGGGQRFADALDDVRIWARALSAAEIRELVKAAPAIQSAAPAIACVDVPYRHVFAAAGSPAPTWSLADAADLPKGLSWDAASATISGTPAVLGVSPRLAVTAANTEGSARQEFEIEVSDVDPAMVAWYRFDDGAGLVARDSSPSGNHGTLTNMTGAEWTAGKVGGALALDGVDDFVDCGNPPSLLIQGDMTLAAWVKPDTVAGERGLASKWSTSWCWVLSHDGTDLGRNAIWFNGWKVSATAVPVGEWSHVALVYSDAADTISFYLNGRPDGTAQQVGNQGTGGNLVIGHRGNPVGSWFDGLIDDVRVYKRALSPAEVQGIFDLASRPVIASRPAGAQRAGAAASASSGGLESSGDWAPADWSNPAVLRRTESGGLKALLIECRAGGARDKVAVRRGLGEAAPGSEGMDLAASRAVTLNAFNAGKEPVAVALALATADGFFESLYYWIKPGRPTALTFDLTAATFKTEDTGWKYESRLRGLGSVREVYFLIYNAEKAATVRVDSMEFRK